MEGGEGKCREEEEEKEKGVVGRWCTTPAMLPLATLIKTGCF